MSSKILRDRVIHRPKILRDQDIFRFCSHGVDYNVNAPTEYVCERNSKSVYLSQLLLVKHLFGTYINISNHLCINIHHHMFHLYFKLVHWYGSSLFGPTSSFEKQTKCDFNSQDSNSAANCKILSEIKNLILNAGTS